MSQPARPKRIGPDGKARSPSPGEVSPNQKATRRTTDEPLRTSDPFRDSLNRLALADARIDTEIHHERREARLAIAPVASEVRAVLKKSIGIIESATVDTRHGTVDFNVDAPGAIALSSLRSIVLCDQLVTLVDLPAVDLRRALDDVIVNGMLTVATRAQAVDALRTLHATVLEAEQTGNAPLISRLLPVIVRLTLVLSLEGVAGGLAATAVGEDVAKELVKALVVALVIYIAVEAKKAAASQRQTARKSGRARSAHKQILRDLAYYDSLAGRDEEERARSKLILILDVAVLRKRTFDLTWDSKEHYWNTLDEVQDWLEVRRWRGGRETFPRNLEKNRPPMALPTFKRQRS